MSRYLNLGLLLGCMVSSLSFASQNNHLYAQGNNYPLPVYSFSAEFSQYNADFDYGDKVELKGVAFSIAPSPHYSGLLGRAEFLNNKAYDVDYAELVAGGQISLFRDPNFYALGTIGLGYGWLSADYFRNDVEFVSLPIAIEVGMTPIETVSIYAGLGYKLLWDMTSNTTCRDGTTTDKIGYGSCSYHGGVAYYNDSIGDNSGVTYKAGVRLNF